MSTWKNRLVLIEKMANRCQNSNTCPRVEALLLQKESTDNNVAGDCLRCPLKKGQKKNKCLENKTSVLSEAVRMTLMKKDSYEL